MMGLASRSAHADHAEAAFPDWGGDGRDRVLRRDHCYLTEGRLDDVG